MSTSVIGFTGFLVAAIVVVAVARKRSRRRVEHTAQLRDAARLAVARRSVGMTAGHPEKPLPPGDFEATFLGDQYAYFAAQLADIDVTNPGGPA